MSLSPEVRKKIVSALAREMANARKALHLPPSPKSYTLRPLLEIFEKESDNLYLGCNPDELEKLILTEFKGLHSEVARNNSLGDTVISGAETYNCLLKVFQEAHKASGLPDIPAIENSFSNILGRMEVFNIWKQTQSVYKISSDLSEYQTSSNSAHSDEIVHYNNLIEQWDAFNKSEDLSSEINVWRKLIADAKALQDTTREHSFWWKLRHPILNYRQKNIANKIFKGLKEIDAEKFAQAERQSTAAPKKDVETTEAFSSELQKCEFYKNLTPQEIVYRTGNILYKEITEDVDILKFDTEEEAVDRFFKDTEKLDEAEIDLFNSFEEDEFSEIEDPFKLEEKGKAFGPKSEQAEPGEQFFKLEDDEKIEIKGEDFVDLRESISIDLNDDPIQEIKEGEKIEDNKPLEKTLE